MQVAQVRQGISRPQLHAFQHTSRFLRKRTHHSRGVALNALPINVPSLLDNLSAALVTKALFLADITDAVDPTTVEAAADTASKKGGWLAIFSDSFESVLKGIDNVLGAAHIPYSYGFSIILLTLLVKVATYPLSAKQVQSTLSLQALQPQVKELQAKYANDQEKLQLETAKLYQTAGVNPLAGCLPALVTIPVFIGLYRALSNVADEGLLTEGFFWIPSLAGPTKLNGGLGWLVPGPEGTPPLGWHDTIAYLVMPVLLVVSQWASQKILSPAQSADPAQQQSQAILKFIPLMIGWFSLNVPSGLTLYWLTNNIVTTAQQLYLRRAFDASAVTTTAGGQNGSVMPSSRQIGNTPAEPEPAPRPTGKDLGSRRGEKFRSLKAREAAVKASGLADDNGNGTSAVSESEMSDGGEVIIVPEEDITASSEEPKPSSSSSGKKKGKKGKK